MTIGERIVEQRKKLGMTRVQLAQDLDIPHTTLRNYETDQREPGHKTLIALSQRFGVTTDYLLLGNDESEQIKKSPTPEGAEDDTYIKFVDQLTRMLASFSLINERGDITDEDRRFILSVASMLNTYFENRG